MERSHPFDLVFGELAERHFPAIRDRLAARAGDLGAFVGEPAVNRLVDEMAATGTQEPAAVEALMLLAFSAFRYWLAGSKTLRVRRREFTATLASPPEPGPMPPGSWYVEFPPRWFWAQIDTDVPPEPLEGIFVTVTNRGAGHLIVAVLGVRPGRDGFSQLAVSAGRADVQEAAGCVRRPLFRPVLEGGEQSGFRSLTSVAELIHLTHLALDSASE